MCFIGDDIWKEIKNYFKNNVSTLESELKKYREIDDFNKITVYDVLIQKKNEIDIDKISRDFRNYVNNRNNNMHLDACEKFINKNIVGHLDNIKEMLEIKGRRAYFRHKPNTDKELIQDKYNILYDSSDMLWKILKEKHEKDKNIQKDNLSTDKKNEFVDANKPAIENGESEINTQSKQ